MTHLLKPPHAPCYNSNQETRAPDQNFSRTEKLFRREGDDHNYIHFDTFRHRDMKKESEQRKKRERESEEKGISKGKNSEPPEQNHKSLIFVFWRKIKESKRNKLIDVS